MFENLNLWEIGALLMLALLIFGDRLPKVIGDGLRMLRNLRSMAQNATSDLSRELGTDVKLEDLHPKAFIRKHILSEDEESALRKPLQSLFDDVKQDLNGVKTELNGVRTHLDETAAGIRDATSRKTTAPAEVPRPAQRFDLDAT
ncbi:Sec-independent protein translocase family protein [Actinoplanes siamensis]|uniref:Sec-independent protein translocase protein TatB n=1 Tax=Actinoplanes siamensis TaxID=1223317 RepID=A0A919TKK8_9ACTN|nr:preprotein translocase subunit TatB [Actinoplanes siamensis]GIF06141.1 sec-independent protein translocase protein TatB [Actinoplanes siamensis]